MQIYFPFLNTPLDGRKKNVKCIGPQNKSIILNASPAATYFYLGFLLRLLNTREFQYAAEWAVKNKEINVNNVQAL